MKAIAGSQIKAKEVLTQAAETDEGNPVVCPARADSKPFAVSLTDAEPELESCQVSQPHNPGQIHLVVKGS